VLPEIGDTVAQRLREEQGVSQVDASRLTGSLLIAYDPHVVQLPRIVEVLVRVGGLHGLEVDVGADVTHVPRPGERLRDLLGQWDRIVRNAAGGQIDLRGAVPGALAATGIGLFLAGRRRIPEWYDLLFWSFVTFVNLNPPKPHVPNGSDVG